MHVRPRPNRPGPAALALAALLVAALALGGGAAHAQGEDPNLRQTLERDAPIAPGPAGIADGHVDIGPHFVDGDWTLLVHDDSALPPVWRSPDDTVLVVDDDAVVTVPDDGGYGFLGATPGARVHLIPQVQAQGVVWAGWNTQDPEVMERIDRGATLTLRGVHGPGQLTVYLQAGNFGDVDVLWTSADPAPQPFWVEVNTHTHANWVFTEPGAYLVHVEVSADLIDGTHVSDLRTLRFAVGDATTVANALAVPAQPPAPTETAGGSSAPASGQDEGGSGAVVVLVVVAGASVLIAAVATFAIRGAAARRRAELPDEHAPAPGPAGGHP